MTAVFLAVVGCGGGGGDGPSGVDSTKQVSAVSDDDKASLCDWFAGMVGGYAAEPDCAAALLTAPPDKATCTTDFPVCAVTIAQFESCVRQVVSAQNACTQQALVAAQNSTECQAVGEAGCFD